MIPRSSKVIIIEASEPEGSAPASIAWQLAEDSKASTAAAPVCAAGEAAVGCQDELTKL